jgi:protoporphyrinogen oxidase
MIYILGGGPTGLACAHGIAEASDMPFIVIERRPKVGGLAQTIRWEGHGLHDLGPHKIFTLDKDLMARVLALRPKDEWLLRPKQSSIYMNGHFLPYPLSPFSLISVYGLSMFAGMVLNYAAARVRSKFNSKVVSTFKEDLVSRVGERLYKALFEPIALKLWGDPARLDVRLSKGRVQTPSLNEVIKRLLNIRASSSFEALEFWYPKGGLQTLWESIVEKTGQNGTYLLNKEVMAIDVKDNTVDQIRYKDRFTGEVVETKVNKYDFVFSTLPLGGLPGIMGSGISKNTADMIGKVVKLNELILVFLKIDKPSLIEESWVFVPDPGIVFHRLSEQESFDPGMVPNGSIVCCEIMSNDARPLGRLPDVELIEAAKKGLYDMGYKGFSVTDELVIRLPESYPVYETGFETAMEKIIDELDGIKNFRTIGRQGAFNYIGTLDAMDIGYGAMHWLTQHYGRVEERTEWKKERERTRNYPVLD